MCQLSCTKLLGEGVNYVLTHDIAGGSSKNAS